MFTIVHPTDLAEEQRAPFAHAVALAVQTRAKLVALHAEVPGEPVRPDADAQDLLTSWGRTGALPYSFLRHRCCDDPVDTCLDALKHLEADLLVVGTHGKSGARRLLQDSFSEAIALETRLPTLFVPTDAHGFVDAKSGALGLSRVVVPAGGGVAHQPAVDQVLSLLARVRADGDQNRAWVERPVEQAAAPVDLVILHVGDGPFPATDVPPGLPVHVSQVRRKGQPAEEILRHCEETNPDLIAMSTEGHAHVLDFLRGSKTEQVTRKARRPVLSVAVPRP